ncbi:MAG: hypothetical protein O2968_15525 [Acidobacteria bacterium]|nr:hypothetical protein [Acidobacteriota bacterium]
MGVWPASCFIKDVTSIEQILPAALALIASFALALVAEWGVLSVIVRALAPNPRSAVKEPFESH